MDNPKQIQLQKEIDSKRAEIRSDQYPMSIGEIVGMYKNGELDIHPEFQRFYRWDADQKSRFIESIYLGIPIPSLFVAQKADGKWDVVDGLQRLSTIFELMGVLKDENDKKIEPLTLTKTKYLPSFEGLKWESTDGLNSLTQTQRLLLKRAKLDLKIILYESSEKAKFELFHRLNTGGSELSDQEIRNAMLVGMNRNFYDWLLNLKNNSDFQQCVVLSDSSYLEQYDVELILRFLVLSKITMDEAKRIGDIGDFLTDSMVNLSETFANWCSEEEKLFSNTFAMLSSGIGDESFRRYDDKKKKFLGGFLISAFEIVALGIGYNLRIGKKIDPNKIQEKIQKVWSNPDFISSSGSGIRASTRIPKTLETGRTIFST